MKVLGVFAKFARFIGSYGYYRRKGLSGLQAWLASTRRM